MLNIGNSIVFLLLSTATCTLASVSSSSDGVSILHIRTNDSPGDVKSAEAPSEQMLPVSSNSTISSTMLPITIPTTSPTTASTTVPTTIPTTPPTTNPTTVPTTPIPSTTTTPIPSTTTTPTPSTTTPPKIMAWFVEDNGTICIIANMVVKVNVPYKTAGNNKTVDAEFKIEKLEDAIANGTCGKQSQTLILNRENFTATFNFVQNTTEKTYLLSTIELNIVVNNYTFPNNSMVNVTGITLKHENQVFSVPMNHSYICASVDPLSLNGTVAVNETVTGSFSVSNVHVEAFGTGKEAKYSAPMDCAGTQTPDIVPIAVGLILAGLVIVVLVAYLVGRRRAQARGYLSM